MPPSAMFRSTFIVALLIVSVFCAEEHVTQEPIEDQEAVESKRSTHSQKLEQGRTRGEYRIFLPDNRWQIVSYVADDDGYRATVRYENGPHDILREEQSHWGFTTGSSFPNDEAARIDPLVYNPITPPRIPHRFNPHNSEDPRYEKPPYQPQLKPPNRPPYPGVLTSQVNTFIIHPTPTQRPDDGRKQPHFEGGLEPKENVERTPPQLSKDVASSSPSSPPPVYIPRPYATGQPRPTTPPPVYTAPRPEKFPDTPVYIPKAKPPKIEIKDSIIYDPNEYHPFFQPIEKPKILTVQPIRPFHLPDQFYETRFKQQQSLVTNLERPVPPTQNQQRPQEPSQHRPPVPPKKDEERPKQETKRPYLDKPVSNEWTPLYRPYEPKPNTEDFVPSYPVKPTESYVPKERLPFKASVPYPIETDVEQPYERPAFYPDTPAQSFRPQQRPAIEAATSYPDKPVEQKYPEKAVEPQAKPTIKPSYSEKPAETYEAEKKPEYGTLPPYPAEPTQPYQPDKKPVYEPNLDKPSVPYDQKQKPGYEPTVPNDEKLYEPVTAHPSKPYEPYPDKEDIPYEPQAEYVRPGKQEYERPEKQEYERPAEPEYKRPEKPEYKPAPSYGEKPYEPVTAYPGKEDTPYEPQAEYERPGKQEYERPEKPEYERPEKPEYERPQKPEYERPQKPEYERPQKPEYERPEKPEYERPEKPEYERPEKPEYKRPEKSEYKPAFYGDNPYEPVTAYPNKPTEPVAAYPDKPETPYKFQPEYERPEKPEYQPAPYVDQSYELVTVYPDTPYEPQAETAPPYDANDYKISSYPDKPVETYEPENKPEHVTEPLYPEYPVQQSPPPQGEEYRPQYQPERPFIDHPTDEVRHPYRPYAPRPLQPVRPIYKRPPVNYRRPPYKRPYGVPHTGYPPGTSTSGVTSIRPILNPKNQTLLTVDLDYSLEGEAPTEPPEFEPEGYVVPSTSTRKPEPPRKAYQPIFRKPFRDSPVRPKVTRPSSTRAPEKVTEKPSSNEESPLLAKYKFKGSSKSDDGYGQRTQPRRKQSSKQTSDLKIITSPVEDAGESVGYNSQSVENDHTYLITANPDQDQISELDSFLPIEEDFYSSNSSDSDVLYFDDGMIPPLLLRVRDKVTSTTAADDVPIYVVTESIAEIVPTTTTQVPYVTSTVIPLTTIAPTTTTTKTTTSTVTPSTKAGKKKKKKRVRTKGLKRGNGTGTIMPASKKSVSVIVKDEIVPTANVTLPRTSPRIRFPPRVRFVQKTAERVTRQNEKDGDLVASETAHQSVVSRDYVESDMIENHAMTKEDLMEWSLNAIPIERLDLVYDSIELEDNPAE
ncbi:uncharacterized protein LOC130688275 [Daphnia carinata]|uniref:uncharacterized protein LOC130688275 n=1 Tax=Daphnia carinata TaxID=120202 RepID=UPI00257ACCDE|nr:uncharacterized protein LOC130688275 [Daphnia carinata]